MIDRTKLHLKHIFEQANKTKNIYSKKDLFDKQARRANANLLCFKTK